jgi:hypothetical protein
LTKFGDKSGGKNKCNKKYNSMLFREKRQAPFVIFPEILVIVDYDGYR